MKKRVIKITAGLAAMLLVILGLAGLDYLVNEDRKEDPVTRNVQAAQKDSYNQYGLTLDTELADQPFYEDETYIYYTDRLLKKFQYKEKNLEDAAVIMKNLQSVIPETVNQFFMPIPDRIMWEEGYREQKGLYNDWLEKAKTVTPDKIEFLDVLPILNEHKNEYLFFRTDSEWTARGAYYGSVLFCERTGIEPIVLDGYEEYMYNTFQGTMKQEMLKAQENNSEIFTKVESIPDDPLFSYLIPGSKNRAIRTGRQNDWEGVDKIRTVSKSRPGNEMFIGNHYQWALAEGDAKDEIKGEQTALILCDANGKLMVPYLTSYYKQVYIINVTYNQFSVEQLKRIFREYEITDFIWAQSAIECGDVSKSILLKKIYDMSG